MPTVSNDGASGFTPAADTKPCDGLKPQIPQLLAGTRVEPPVSVPNAKSTNQHATAEADPLDCPPGTRSGACALRGVPQKSFSPRRLKANSSEMVFPMQR